MNEYGSLIEPVALRVIKLLKTVIGNRKAANYCAKVGFRSPELTSNFDPSISLVAMILKEV